MKKIFENLWDMILMIVSIPILTIILLLFIIVKLMCMATQNELPEKDTWKINKFLDELCCKLTFYMDDYD